MKKWLIRDLLQWTSQYFFEQKLEQSRLEAEVLLGHVLNQNRIYLYSNYDKPVNVNELTLYRELIKRRISGEPLAYILGYKEFMSLEFKVNPTVLIPRPDTEILVEKALELIDINHVKHVCDVGTGSGAIAISLAYYRQDIKVSACDISADALEIARENAVNHNVDINFYHSDLLDALQGEKFDLITANLPYISEAEFAELDLGVKNYEPSLALLAEENGLSLYRRLLTSCSDFLNDGAFIIIEISPEQVNEVKQIVFASGLQYIVLVKDLAGRDRVILARRKNADED